MLNEAKKSTHRVEVVPVVLEKHPDADSLSVVHIYGFTCVVRTEDWLGINRAAYIPPDSVVDARREPFTFLARDAKDDGSVRIKARRLRGIQSFGLLVPVSEDTPLGGDVAEELGVTHYEPPVAAEQGGKGGLISGGEDATGPNVYAPKYDLDAFRRYHDCFTPGEPVIVSEKLDGASARYVFWDGQMYCGSRNNWKREYADYSHITLDYLIEKGCPVDKAEQIIANLAGKPRKQNTWWEVMHRTPALRAFCENHPGVVVYGEIFNSINCIRYGLPANQFAAFDMKVDGQWADRDRASEMFHIWGVPMAPFLNETDGDAEELLITPIPYDFDRICELAEGPTLVQGAKAGVIREGVVVEPYKTRTDPRVGRVKLKVVSATYLEKYR